MRRDITVAAQPRASRGKNEARRTRKHGLVPAVVYGAFKDPVAVAVSPREIMQIVHSASGYNTIFNLDIEGVENTPVMVVDQQFDPVRGTLLHADLKRIDLTKRIRVSIPVTTQGEPKGVKTQGGLLELVTRAAEIECLPDEIPEHFMVDVRELLIGQSKRFSDLPHDRLDEADQLAGHRDRARGDHARRRGCAGRRGRARWRPKPRRPPGSRKSSRRARRKKPAEEAKPKKK